MDRIPGKFIWFEHVSADVAAARAFYTALLPWRVSDEDMGGPTPYPLIRAGEAGIGGFRRAPPGAPNHWACFLSVEDVDASTAAAQAAGAQVVMPPTDFAPVGRGAGVIDPTGAAFALWTCWTPPRPDNAQPVAGDWCWSELMTGDARRALAFYTTVFGYTSSAMDMGAQGTYHLLLTGQTPRAGLMQNPAPDMPSVWSPYVWVADTDATAARAAELGATVCVAPAEIPNVGRFTMLLDPFGAVIGILGPGRD